MRDGDHSYEPVPFVAARLSDAIHSNDRPPRFDAVCAFDEISVARGCLGRFSGNQVMPLIQKLAAKTEF